MSVWRRLHRPLKLENFKDAFLEYCSIFNEYSPRTYALLSDIIQGCLYIYEAEGRVDMGIRG